jgi:acyl-CoA synthetase (NDP forming)
MDFTPLFNPETMAVIGMSLHNDQHPANVILNKNRLRFPVKVFPVNPSGGTYQGERVYKNIKEVPEPVDLAIIAVRADIAPETMKDCIEAGVKSAVVVSGGFAEVGKKDVQDEMVRLAKAADFPFLGPNCLGIYNPSRADTFFLPPERMVRPDPGSVAVVSQSGGILVDQLIKFQDEGIGLSMGVSIGNKALIREIHLLDYLARDEKTDVIAFYIEGFSPNEGRLFAQAARECPKPVIVMKAGKSAEGSRAVSSHTASLAGDYRIFSSALDQAGVVEAKNEFEFVAFCESLSCYTHNIAGHVGIITGSGGHGAMAVDACLAQGLEVPVLGELLQGKLREGVNRSIQAIASYSNPVDLTGSAVDEDFVHVVETLSQSSEIDVILILLLPYIPGMSSDLSARLSQIYLNTQKPIVAYIPHVEKYRMFIEGFELNRIPVSHSIEGSVFMVEAMRRCRSC